MMFLLSSFVIVDNFELVVNEECIFYVTTDYERIHFNDKAQTNIKNEYFKTINITSLCA